MFCMEQSLKCVAGNVNILQFVEAFNVPFDLECAFGCIRVMIPLSVQREVVTMAFICKAAMRLGARLSLLSLY